MIYAVYDFGIELVATYARIIYEVFLSICAAADSEITVYLMLDSTVQKIDISRRRCIQDGLDLFVLIEKFHFGFLYEWIRYIYSKLSPTLQFVCIEFSYDVVADAYVAGVVNDNEVMLLEELRYLCLEASFDMTG